VGEIPETIQELRRIKTRRANNASSTYHRRKRDANETGRMEQRHHVEAKIIAVSSRNIWLLLACCRLLFWVNGTIFGDDVVPEVLSRGPGLRLRETTSLVVRGRPPASLKIQFGSLVRRELDDRKPRASLSFSGGLSLSRLQRSGV